MNLVIIASIIWLPVAAIQLSALLYYWQRKEYRIDRMLDFLRFDEGKLIIVQGANLTLVLCALINTIVGSLNPWLNIILAGTTTLATLTRVKTKGILRPKVTNKLLVILGIFLTAFSFLIWINWQFFLNSILIWQPIVISLIVITFQVPTKFAKQYYIQKASKIISQKTDLICIGITGSYGKSSTKEFLAHILSAAGSANKTPANINTEIGVARHIIKTANSKDNFLVCEMGAYKKGEIKKIAKMTKPQIGIITAIENQHLSLFGTREAIKQAKSELVQNLSGKKIAILNYEQPLCQKVGQELQESNPETEVYYYSKLNSSKSDLKLIASKKTDHGWEIKINYKNKEFNYQLPNIAEALIENTLPVILAAKLVAVSEKNIQKQLETLPIPGQSLTLKKSINGLTIIDDSYNGNPSGFQAGINQLKNLPQSNKYCVTIGLLELGKEGPVEHAKLGKLLNDSQIKTIVLKQLAYEQMLSGINNNNSCISYISDNDEIINILKNSDPADTAIFIANRIPTNLKNKIFAL